MRVKDGFMPFWKGRAVENKLIFLFVVQETLLNGIVYSREEKELKMVGLGTPQSWNGREYSSFKEAIEKSLGDHLKKKKKVRQVIFVVSPFWTISGEDLTKTKAAILKSLCQEYHWPPGGFVIDDESLVFHFRGADEIPPSFISLLIRKEGFRISLAHLGKIKKRLKLDSRHLSPQEIKEALGQLGFEGILPPKFIIWGDLPSDFEEEMVNYSWTDKGDNLFLHLPEIQILDWPQLALIFKDVVAARIADLPAVSEPEKLPPGFSFEDLGSKEKTEGMSEKEPPLSSPPRRLLLSRQEKKESLIFAERSISRWLL